MEDLFRQQPPLDTGTPFDSGPPVLGQPLPTPGEDPYPDLFIASIDPSDPILSGTRSSSWNSMYDAIQNPQSV